MRPAVIGAAAVIAAVGAIATSQGYGPVASSHLFAPSLSITCEAPDHVVTSWVRASDFSRITGGASLADAEARGNAAEHWGWVEYGGCGQSLTIHAGAR